MIHTDDKPRQILLKKFDEGVRRNSRWSKRAFARRIGISSGALTEIMNGKRPLSVQVKKKLAPKLELSPKEQLEFFEDELPNYLQGTPLEYHLLNEDQFRMIADWPHYAILNLIKTKGFKPSVEWIARRLNVPFQTAETSWQRLLRMGHLKKIGGKVIRKFPRLNTSDGVINLSVREAHIQDTKLIEASLRENPIEIRDHTSMTLVTNKKNLARAKEMIRLFQDQFAQEIQTDPGEEVYRLSISLFPLSHSLEEKK